MDKYGFYKSFYDRELNRRKDLDNSVNLPLTIIGILITANFYFAKSAFPIKSLCDFKFKHLVMIIFFALIIISIAYLAKSYNNFYKGFKYKNIANYRETRNYELRVEKYNENVANEKDKLNFDLEILEKLVDIADNHCTINDKRSYDLYIAKTIIIITIFITIINYIIFGIFI